MATTVSWARQALLWRWAWLRDAVADRMRAENVSITTLRRWLDEQFMSHDFTAMVDDLIEERHGRRISFGYTVTSHGYYW